ncbi:MAG: VWA domain-containing protein, partial [Vicinamibacterales bacterium]
MHPRTPASGRPTRGDARRPLGRATAVVLGALMAVTSSVHAQAPSDAPRFRSSVDVTSVDVTVVDDRGRPLLDLKPEEFAVRIDNARRRVVTAEWTPLVTLTGPPPPPPPEGYTSNEAVSGGRLMLIVVDQPNIRFGATLSIQRAVNEFLDRLQPTDRIAAVAIGPGNASTPFTADRERVKRAIAQMSGLNRQFSFNDFDIAQNEALDIARGTLGALDRVVARECSGAAQEIGPCVDGVRRQSMQLASDAQMNGQLTLSSLRTLLRGLANIDVPKTLLFLSEGFPIDDHRATVAEIGALAGLAQTSIYAVRLDNQLFDISDPSLPATPFFARGALAESMDTLAASARGASLTINGAGSGIFERIESELSGYYLLGVESAPTDKDGAPHPIRVDVARRGTTVRFRRVLKSAVADPAARLPRQLVAGALATPLPLSGLPLKAAAFSLQGPERGRVQLLIHTDIGSGYTEAARVSVAYYIADADGRVVDSRTVEAPLPPVMKGVPSPLQYVTGASLPPGDYTFKLAAVDGDKVGSVEHPFRASLSETAGVTFSDLIVGGPIDTRDIQHPTVSHLISFGSVQGYLEVYGSGLDRISAR